MRLRLIRNATLRLSFGGVEFLIDPYLAPRHSLPSYAGRSPNPLVELPVPAEEILSGVEVVVVSHLHSDHFDKGAREELPKELPLLCQPGDEERIRTFGFESVAPVREELSWGGVAIERTAGRHGSGAAEKELGAVSGFVFRHPREPTLYWAGDTIWCGEVAAVIAAAQPPVIVTHSSGASWKGSPPIVMDAEQTLAVCRAAPASVVVAVHLDALDHGTVSRTDLRAAARAAGIPDARLRIPADGETLAFPDG